jgi:hypothetical protein
VSAIATDPTPAANSAASSVGIKRIKKISELGGKYLFLNELRAERTAFDN